MMVRQLVNDEIDDLLSLGVVARLATIDTAGYPHVTPIWFAPTPGSVSSSISKSSSAATANAPTSSYG